MNIELDGVYFDILARTEKLDQGLNQAEARVNQFTAFLEGHPAAVAGALGTSLLTIGVAAINMAAKTELALTQLGNIVPNFGNSLQKVRDQIGDLTRSTGTAFDELLEGARAIAEQGTKGPEDLATRLDIVNKVSIATGLNIAQVGTALGKVAREFDISGDAIQGMAEKLFVLAKGKVAITDLAEAIAFAAPAVLKFGLDFDTASAAIAFLISKGERARQAGAQIKILLNEGSSGLHEVEEMARAQGKLADGGTALNDAFGAVEKTTVQLTKQLKGDFTEALHDLGESLLPATNTGLSALSAVVRGFNAVLSDGASIAKEYRASLGNLVLPTDKKGLQAVVAASDVSVPLLQDQADALQSKVHSPAGFVKRLVTPGGVTQDVVDLKLIQTQIDILTEKSKEARARLAEMDVPQNAGGESKLLKHMKDIVTQVNNAKDDGEKLQTVLKNVTPQNVTDAADQARNAGDEKSAQALLLLLPKVQAAYVANVAVADKARDQLKSVNEAADNAVLSIQEQATTATGRLMGPFTAALDALDHQLDLKRIALQKKLDEAQKKADTLGPSAAAAQTVTGTQDLAQFDTAAQQIRDGLVLKQQRDLAINDAKTLKRVEDELAIATLDAEGHHAEAAAKRIQLSEQEAEDAIRQQVLQEHLSAGVAARIILDDRRLAGQKLLTAAQAEEAAAAIEIGRAEDALHVERLDAEGKVYAARKLAIEQNLEIYAQTLAQRVAEKNLTDEQAQALYDIAAARAKGATNKVDQDALNNQRAITSELTRTAGAAVDLLVASGAFDATLGNAFKSALSLGDALAGAVNAIHDLSTGTGTVIGTIAAVTAVLGAATTLTNAINSVINAGAIEQAAVAAWQRTAAAFDTTLTDFVDGLNTAVGSLTAALAASAKTIAGYNQQAFSTFAASPGATGTGAASGLAGLIARAPEIYAEGGLPALQQFQKFLEFVAQHGGDPKALDLAFVQLYKDLGITADAAKKLVAADLAAWIKKTDDAYTASLPVVGAALTTITGILDAQQAAIDDATAHNQLGKLPEIAATATNQLTAAFKGYTAATLDALISSGKLTGDTLLLAQSMDTAAHATEDAAATARNTTTIGGLETRLSTATALSDPVGSAKLAAEVHVAQQRAEIAAAEKQLADDVTAHAGAAVIAQDNYILSLIKTTQAVEDAATAEATRVKAEKLATDQANARTSARERIAVATGDTAGAQVYADLAEKEKEATDKAAALAAGFDDVTAQLIVTADQTEYSAATLKKANDLRIATDTSLVNSGLRLATALGDKEAIAKYTALTEKLKEAADYAAALAAGLGAVAAGEVVAADQAEFLASEATKTATALANEALVQSAMRVRLLAAQGDAFGSADLQRTLNETADLTKALAAGYSEATIAMIKNTYAAEDLAARQTEAANAATAAAQALATAAAARNALAGNAIQDLTNQMTLFGIIQPVEQLKELLGVLTKGAPIFAQILGTVDVNSTEGRLKALDQLQQFFLQNPEGVASGNYSAAQVSTQVLNLAALLKSAGTSATTTGGTNSSFAVSQSITTVQADQIGGLLTSMLAIDTEGLAVLKSVATALGARYATVGVPTLPTQTTPGPTGGTTIIQLTINGTQADASQALSPDLQRNIRQLGRDLVREVRFTGLGGS